jgi:hypothetical protein
MPQGWSGIHRNVANRMAARFAFQEIPQKPVRKVIEEVWE